MSGHDSSAPPGFWPPSSSANRDRDNPNQPPSKEEVDIEVQRRLVRKAEFLARGKTMYQPLRNEIDWLKRGVQYEVNTTRLYFFGAATASFVAATVARPKYPAFNNFGFRLFVSTFGGMMGASVGYKKAQEKVLQDLLGLRDSPISNQTYEWFKQVRPYHPFLQNHARDLSTIYNRNEYLSQLPNPLIYPHTIFVSDLPPNAPANLPRDIQNTNSGFDYSAAAREGFLFQKDDMLMTETLDDDLEQKHRGDYDYYNRSGQSPSGIDEWRRKPIQPELVRNPNKIMNRPDEFETSLDTNYKEPVYNLNQDKYIKL